MKHETIAQLTPHIGERVRVTGRSVYQRYQIEGVLERVDLTNRQARIVVRVSEPRTEKGEGWTINFSGLELVSSSHLVSVATNDGRIFR